MAFFTYTFITLTVCESAAVFAALDLTFPTLLEQCFRIKRIQVTLLPSTYIQTRQIVRDIHDSIVTMAPESSRNRPFSTT